MQRFITRFSPLTCFCITSKFTPHLLHRLRLTLFHKILTVPRCSPHSSFHSSQLTSTADPACCSPISRLLPPLPDSPLPVFLYRPCSVAPRTRLCPCHDPAPPSPRSAPVPPSPSVASSVGWHAVPVWAWRGAKRSARPPACLRREGCRSVSAWVDYAGVWRAQTWSTRLVYFGVFML